jgi:hypothetical protein
MASNNTPAPDAWKFEAQNGRQPVGTSYSKPVNASADPGNGKARPRGGANPDQNITGGAGIRKQGKVGAQHRITATLPGPSGEAQATQANGKILPATHSRSGSFYVQGVYDSTGR